VTVETSGITVNGKFVMSLTGPGVEADRSVDRFSFPRLREYLRSNSALAEPVSVCAIAIDPHMTYDVLYRVMVSARRAGCHAEVLVVDVSGATAAIPVAGESAVSPDLVVTVTGAQLSLWSISGAEGTVDNPKLKTTSPADVRNALDEIKRETADAKAPQEVLLMADRCVGVQRIVDVVTSIMRQRAEVPELVFATNFE
jgi:hypothetical protein